MTEPSTTFTIRDGRPVMDSPAPTPTAPAAGFTPAYASMFPEAAAALSEKAYREQSQAAIDAAVAASRAAESGETAGVQPTGETLPAPVADGPPAVADVHALYADSPSHEAREYPTAWPTFAADVPRAQQVAAQMRRAMGETAWARHAEAFDGMSDREQLETMWALSRQGDGAPATSTTTNGNSTMTTTNPADLDAQIEQADSEFYSAFHRSDRAAMTRIDQRRKQLYAAKHPGEIVNGMGRTI
jgi:hypothetical protein